MGFHPLDIIVLIGVALLLFGPRTLQSISHSAGRGMGHAKEAKDKLMKELPVDELSQVSNTISQIPMSPQQVAQKLIGSALKSGRRKSHPRPMKPSESFLSSKNKERRFELAPKTCVILWTWEGVYFLANRAEKDRA